MSYLTKEALEENIQTIEKFVLSETNPSLHYNKTILKTTLDNMYKLFAYDLIDLTNYPKLNNRILAGIINDIEFSAFLYDYKKDINQINSLFLEEISRITTNASITSNYAIPSELNSFFTDFNSYYSKDDYGDIAGDFCSIYTNKIEPALATITTLSGLKNLSVSSFGLFNINDIASNVIDKVIEKIKQKIESLTKNISKISNKFVFNNLHKKIKQIESMFSQESIKSLKESFETMIAKIANQFKKIDAETIQFILHQACMATSGIQNMLSLPLIGIESNMNSFNSAFGIMSSKSNESRLHAITAGAIRLNSDAIISGRYHYSSVLNSSYSTSDAVPSYYITIEADDFERSLVATLNERGNQFVHFTDSVLRMEKDYPSSNPANNIDGAGWRKVHPDAYIKLFRVAKRMGKKFLITSGYRNENKNASLSGSAKHSLHMSGLALDVIMSGVNVGTFIKYASQEGFGGIGTYSSFVHLDIGPRRSWGSYHTDSLSLHNQDRFRRG